MKVQINHAFKDDPFIRKFKLAFRFKFAFNVSLSLTEDELIDHFRGVVFNAARAGISKYETQWPEENRFYYIIFVDNEFLGWALNTAISFANGNRIPKPLNVKMILTRNSLFSLARQKEIPIDDMIAPCRMSIVLDDMVNMSNRTRVACDSDHEVSTLETKTILHDFDCDNRINNDKAMKA